MLTFDIETNGFYREATVIHCIAIHDDADDSLRVYGPDEIDEALARLAAADCLCGHNILKYDLPVLAKVKGFVYRGRIVDTLILARLAKPEIGDEDDKAIRQHRLPAKYRGLHSLEAWGFRLGVLKSEYTGGWETWNQDMHDYCGQDGRATRALYLYLQKFPVPDNVLQLEQDVARIISRQEINGIHFDVDAALALVQKLQLERARLEVRLKDHFGSLYVRDGKPLVPKKDNKARGYTEGAAVQKVKLVDYNPASRSHTAKVLRSRFGWRPTAFTDTGEAEISEESLKAIAHPAAAILVDYFTIEKRLGALHDGKQAWLKAVTPEGKIHGSVNTLGAVTRRMTHSNPNLAQVPAARSPYGKECRALFKPRKGWVLVGCDAASLELRVLAHYMARLDGGEYIKAAIHGKKEDGTDIHTVNMRALEIDSRDDGKTWFYAYIYGGGDEKLGVILTKVNRPAKNRSLGKTKRTLFQHNLPAMGKLMLQIKATAKLRGWLTAIDGGRLYCRKEHAAPNTLFQSAGAIVMKLALVLCDQRLQEKGYAPGTDYEFVLNVHDEWQFECRPEIADAVGETARQSIRDAGTTLGLRCPLDGDFSVGASWADTH